MSRLEQLLRYSSKVYDFPALLKGIKDVRDKKRTQIPTYAVAMAWVIAFWTRVYSREEMGRYLDLPAVQALLGCHISSDSLGRVPAQIELDSLRDKVLVPVVRGMRRNKAWHNGTVAGQVFVAFDASEAFSSRLQHCEKCLSRSVEVHGEIVTEYYHRAVWAFIVGTEPKVYLDVEPLEPGEGELTAAIRLVARIGKEYGRWVDGIVADGLYAAAPFLNTVRSAGLHYLVRVKGETRYIVKDMEAKCTSRSPDAVWTQHIGHHRLRSEAWDEKELLSWEGLAPVRMVACRETELAETPRGRRQFAQPERERSRAYFVTSYSKTALPTEAVCLVYHRRWDIENAGFRQLKEEWHWDHAFVHTPKGLPAVWLLLAIAVDLFIAFAVRHLHPTAKQRPPLRTLATQLTTNLLNLDVLGSAGWAFP